MIPDASVSSSSAERLPKKARAVLESRVCDGAPTKLLFWRNWIRISAPNLTLVEAGAGHSCSSYFGSVEFSPRYIRLRARKHFGYWMDTVCCTNCMLLRSSTKKLVWYERVQLYQHDPSLWPSPCLQPCFFDGGITSLKFRLTEQLYFPLFRLCFHGATSQLLCNTLVWFTSCYLQNLPYTAVSPDLVLPASPSH